MNRLHLTVTLSAVLLLSLLFWNRAPGSGRILRVSDGAVIPLSEAVKDLKQTRLVFVGELHTQESHHEAQLEVIRALRDEGLSIAVGLEMFKRESQAALDRWSAGKLSEKKFQKIYYENWSYSWPLYRDIFLFARDQGIELIGLNLPREVTRQVARQGFASLTPEQRGDLPMVTCRVDPEYQAFIRRSLGMHAHGSMDFTNFCEAQVVWDTAMAWNLLRFLEKNPTGTVVVLAGSGHAWKQGIPAQIRSRSPIPFRVILPEIRGRLDRTTIGMDDADYLWLERK
jgi:uncharacterized iron-regulated protein